MPAEGDFLEEYIPGSEVYLVWLQGVTEFGDPGEVLFEALHTNLVRKQPENIFLLKATYIMLHKL